MKNLIADKSGFMGWTILLPCFAILWGCCQSQRPPISNYSTNCGSGKEMPSGVINPIDTAMAKLIIDGEYEKAVRKSAYLLTSAEFKKSDHNAAAFWMDMTLLMMGVAQDSSKTRFWIATRTKYLESFVKLPDSLKIELMSAVMNKLNQELYQEEKIIQDNRALIGEKNRLAERIDKMERLIRDLENIK